MKLNKLYLFALLSVFVFSCTRDYDEPPIKEIASGQVVTIADLQARHANNNGQAIKFSGDTTLFAVVTMDESTGNLYKNVYIQDGTGGINVRLVSTGGLYEGDSIRINLNGVILDDFDGVLQLDSVDVDENIVKQATGVTVAPQVVTLPQVSTSLVNTLVKIENVEFEYTEWGNTYADAANLQSENRILVDCNGNQLIVRTSGYANFADDLLPTGNGSIIGVVGKFGSDMQLYVRRPSEVALTASTCQPTFYEVNDFSGATITAGGWQVFTPVGSGFQWSTSDQGSSGNFYAVASGYNGSNNNTEQWLVSPAVDLSASSFPIVNFRNAYNYSGPALEFLVSTDWDGVSDPSTQGTWTDLSSNATWSTGGFSWANSGDIDLSAYKQSGVYFAFRYTSTTSGGSTWEVDDFTVTEL